MDDHVEVFHDFSSDTSDDDSNDDWNSINEDNRAEKQAMRGTELTRTVPLHEVSSIPHSLSSGDTSPALKTTKSTVFMVEKVARRSCSDEELLDELFPILKQESTTRIERQVEVQSEEKHSAKSTLMPLEERGRQLCATKDDVDCANLFKEMYGSNPAIASSTLSRSTESIHDSASDEHEMVDNVALHSSRNMDSTLPVRAFDIVLLVYKNVSETQRDLSSLLKEAGQKLCLDDQFKLPIPLRSLDSFRKAVDSLEEHLHLRDFVNALAPTRRERLELVLVALDDNDVLPDSIRLQWNKVIPMLPLLAKIQEQSKATTATANRTRILEVDMTSMSSKKTKTKERLPLKGWATFYPEKMPSKRCEPMIMTSRSEQLGSRKKLCVRIRQHTPAKVRTRCKAYNPAEAELTFRPKINYSKKVSKHEKENVTARMDRDIVHRRLQKQQHEQERELKDLEEAQGASTGNLIAKGSQRILLKNGMWTESFEDRLGRLAKHRSNVETHDAWSTKRRRQQRQRRREASATALRACESLYQRGIEQRRREEERVQEDNCGLELQRNRSKLSSRSRRVIKKRIRQELAQVCLASQRSASKEAADNEGEADHNIVSFVTFLEFSYALLYFGFVLDGNTPWGNENNDSEVTLLWHSWTVFTQTEREMSDSKLSMQTLEKLVIHVILGGRTDDHVRFQDRNVQVLLRLYRANYYATRYTQHRRDPSNECASKCHREDSRKEQLRKRSSSRRQRVCYSLHGKPIQNNGIDVLSEREELLREKLDQMRAAKAMQELTECTFHPSIRRGPSKATSVDLSQESSPAKTNGSSSATVSTFQRLYSDAFLRQHNVVQKYLQAEEERKELERQEGKVLPSCVNGLTIEERLENLHIALAGNTVPMDFHKKINAMRAATEMRALDAQLKERQLRPTQFKRAEDGKTIILPFQLATETRAALGIEKEKLRTKVAQLSSDYTMKDLRRVAVEKRELQTLLPLQKGNATDCRTALRLDIHLSSTETHPLYLNSDDDARKVAESFAQRYSLSNTQRHFLVQLVEARLEHFASLERKS